MWLLITIVQGILIAIILNWFGLNITEWQWWFWAVVGNAIVAAVRMPFDI